MAVRSFLEDIYYEQKKYDSRVMDQFIGKYNNNYEQILAKTRCIIHETVELERELQGSWKWWKKVDTKDECCVTSDQLRAMRFEAIDIFKFLLSLLIDLGVDDQEKFWQLYMEKHQIINERLDKIKKMD
jgi:hypothetical protein